MSAAEVYICGQLVGYVSWGSRQKRAYFEFEPDFLELGLDLAPLTMPLDRFRDYQDTFNVVRKLQLPYSQHEQLYRRLVFNVVARNIDDHNKNISFLMDRDGTWRLAPAYDLLFTYAPADPDFMNKHEMSIGGKVDEIMREDLLRFGDKMGSTNRQRSSGKWSKPCRDGRSLPRGCRSHRPSNGWLQITCCCGVKDGLVVSNLKSWVKVDVEWQTSVFPRVMMRRAVDD